jgi:predicted RNase H-like HicB family nuclease
MNTKKLDYLIKLTYDKKYKGYVADVVNLYGCMSQGKTKKEALGNAEKAIKAYMKVVTKREKNAEFAKKSVNTSICLSSLNA